MINLIPPIAKRGIVIEYWTRVITVYALLVSLAVVASIVALLPSYVLVNSQVSVYKNSATAASEKIASFQNVSAELTRASEQARIILSTSETTSLSTFIYLMESLQDPGITLSQVSVARGDTTDIAPILLVGVAEDRQQLADFRDRLLKEPIVASVDFPISNLAKDRDITFTITVVLKPISATP